MKFSVDKWFINTYFPPKPTLGFNGFFAHGFSSHTVIPATTASSADRPPFITSYAMNCKTNSSLKQQVILKRSPKIHLNNIYYITLSTPKSNCCKKNDFYLYFNLVGFSWNFFSFHYFIFPFPGQFF